MHDKRLDQLAHVLVTHSTRVEAGNTVLIESINVPEEMVIRLLRAIREAGGHPMVTLKTSRIQRELIRAGEDATMKQIGEYEAFRMDKVDCYVAMRGSDNISEMSDVSTEAMRSFEEHWLKPVHMDIRVPKTRWVVLRWPSPSMAQQAQMSTEAFEDFYFNVCTLDYDRMQKAADPLKALMESTDEVHITGPGTDLRFSIKDIPVVACTGAHNIPDGECFTAPVRESVNGTIHYNAATQYRGTVFNDVKLRFEKGRIVEATADHADKVQEIFDTDDGARFIGEFAIGFNPYITTPMLDTLFDEKIAGSFHFTPGRAYEQADNGNRSKIHWDMVVIQTPGHGGGQIEFDGRVIRKNGRFVVPELEGLNPDALK